eukprot:CAMPEP_0169452650 /NCGR_PEP_ID=MMETSP1042-20121227/14351_1 /TAXON_ID=464988 /ORGANISM="Hemiselmis andersenii, Strain CCMP1180" /LENGTH=411 /DNA_ID=CAMNT_0009564657 /DNA_START=186 /DNA_END=1418 /DNA_ORIENTATION=+
MVVQGGPAAYSKGDERAAADKHVRPVLGPDGMEFVVEDHRSGGKSLCRCPEITPRPTPPPEGCERPLWMPEEGQDAWEEFLRKVRVAVERYKSQGLYDRVCVAICLVAAGSVLAVAGLSKANVLDSTQFVPLHATVPIIVLVCILVCAFVRWYNSQVDVYIDLLCLDTSKNTAMEADILYYHYRQRNWDQASRHAPMTLTVNTFKAIFVRPKRNLKLASQARLLPSSSSSPRAGSPLVPPTTRNSLSATGRKSVSPPGAGNSPRNAEGEQLPPRLAPPQRPVHTPQERAKGRVLVAAHLAAAATASRPPVHEGRKHKLETGTTHTSPEGLGTPPGAPELPGSSGSFRNRARTGLSQNGSFKAGSWRSLRASTQDTGFETAASTFDISIRSNDNTALRDVLLSPSLKGDAAG